MTKHMSERKRQEALKRLTDEQNDDLASTVLFPETIRPLRPTTLLGLGSKEKASIILSSIGKMSNVEIGEALNCNESSVRGYQRTGYRKLKMRYATK